MGLRVWFSQLWRTASAVVAAFGLLALGAAGFAGAAQVIGGAYNNQIAVRSTGEVYLLQGGFKHRVITAPITDDELDTIPDAPATVTYLRRDQAVLSDRAATAEGAAELLLGTYWVYRNWEAAFEMLHPDQQLVLPRGQWIASQQSISSQYRITAAKPNGQQTLTNWTDRLTQKIYPEVVKVTLTVTYSSNGVVATDTAEVFLAKVGDSWRWFWQPQIE